MTCIPRFLPSVSFNDDLMTTLCGRNNCRHLLINLINTVVCGPVSQSVQRLATGWTVWGSNPGGGRDFSHTSRPALGPTQPPVPGISRG
jgi:hypothetical protein